MVVGLTLPQIEAPMSRRLSKLNEPFSLDVLHNPYPMYESMQSYGVVHMQQAGVWSVFSYDDVRTTLSDYRRFSSEHKSQATQEGQASDGKALISMDPPRHRTLRTLVNKAFTPRAIEELRPRIQDITNDLLDPVMASGETDLIRDLAYPLPVTVIAEMLGIPIADRAKFKRWSDEVVVSADVVLTGQSNPQSQETHDEMNEYFHNIIEQRRQSPSDDLISALIFAQEEDEQLSAADILSICWLLLVAGNETTTNLIGNAVLALLEHPDELEKLLSNPDLLPSAIEEALRFRSPIQAMFRTTTTDVELGGKLIPNGSRMIAWIGAANRDKEKFKDAHRFDITRNPNPHLAFGQGIHFCLGAPLARLEARIALGTIFSRLQQLRRMDDTPLPPSRGLIVFGVSQLPLQFVPSVT